MQPRLPRRLEIRHALGFWTILVLALTMGSQLAAAADADQPVLAVFELGSITEQPAADDFPFGSAGGESLKSLIARMKKARDDAAVKGIVLLMGDASVGSAQIEEIRQVMDELKQAGKPVHVHATSFSTGGFILFSGASRISVVPTGDIWVTGLYGESPYLRGLFDMIGVAPDYFTCGDYKAAAEMFMRTGASPEAKQNQDWLLDGIYQNALGMIAKGRGVGVEVVQKWIDQGLYSAETARTAGLIDAVEHRQEFQAGLQEKYGEKVRFDKRYGKSKRQEIDLSSPFGLIQFYADLLSGPKKRKSTKDAVAVVYVEGPIVAGEGGSGGFPSGMAGATAYSDDIRATLDKVAADDSIKALVLRVDSPGGSAVASEIILDATRRVKARKPIVVSMGNVAGSGGYYVACGADTIFANESTITGSIGVVVGKFATQELWSKVGVRWEASQRGANAGILNTSRVFSDQEREQLKTWMNDVYGVFKGHVTAIRGSRLKKDIEELAGGRVYTGRQALELGLVDKIGGLEDAIKFIAKEASLNDGNYEVRVVPETKSFLDTLLGDITGGHDDERTIDVPRVPRWPTSAQASGLVERAIPLLQGMDPKRVATIVRALRQLELLQNERVLLTMPAFTIRD